MCHQSRLCTVVITYELQWLTSLTTSRSRVCLYAIHGMVHFNLQHYLSVASVSCHQLTILHHWHLLFPLGPSLWLAQWPGTRCQTVFIIQHVLLTFYWHDLKTFFVLSLLAYTVSGGWWKWALVSPDGVAPSQMVGVSASVNLPLYYKVQKFSSGTSSPGWSRKKGR